MREVHAVDEWLASPFPFHTMRDHFYHNSPMMGGMWGVKLKDSSAAVREQLEEAWERARRSKITGAKRNVKGPDQILLEK